MRVEDNLRWRQIQNPMPSVSQTAYIIPAYGNFYAVWETAHSIKGLSNKMLNDTTEHQSLKFQGTNNKLWQDPQSRT